MLRDALLENIHRAQLNPLEEAAAYQQLLEEFGATHEELAARIGRSRPQVTNTIRLLNLPIAGAAPGRGRRALGGARPGAARPRRRRTRRRSSRPDRGRGAVGAGHRGTGALHQRGARPRHRAGRRPGAARISAPAIGELADKLSDAFDTRVRVDLGRRKGKITVEFASVDDLERIVAVMAPQLGRPRAGGSAGRCRRDQPNEP